MTFKHVKFEDSPTMRALEKVAKEKGLVKPEALQKQASISKKADYTPSSDFMENIFKLCSGLRTQGLTKEAAEIETNYLNYKRAQTLYETSKETGEDLVQSAHPKGSHKLEGVDSEEATVEDILDQHMKIVQMIEKKPHGKLSSAAHLLKEVKKALGQASDDLNAQVSALMANVRRRGQQVVNATESELTVSWSHPNDHLSTLSQKPTIDNLREMQSLISKQKWRLKPGVAFGISEDLWSRISPLLDDMLTSVNKAIELRTKVNESAGRAMMDSGVDKPAPPAKSDVTTDMANKIRTTIAQFNSLSGLLSSDDPTDKDSLEKTKAWLSSKAQDLNGILEKFNAEPNKEAVVETYQLTLNKYIQAYTKIKQEWS